MCCLNHTSEAHLVKLPQYPFPPEKIILLVPRASQHGLLRTSALKNVFESNLNFYNNSTCWDFTWYEQDNYSGEKDPEATLNGHMQRNAQQKTQIEFVATCLRWVLCLVASPCLWDLQVDLDLAENVNLLLYFKILHRNKETAWTNKYMDVISKDEPFRCESFSFFEQLGRKLIFFFLHKRSIFCSFPNFSWKFNIHSFQRLKWAVNRLFICNIDRVISFLRLGSKHFLPDFSFLSSSP